MIAGARVVPNIAGYELRVLQGEIDATTAPALVNRSCGRQLFPWATSIPSHQHPRGEVFKNHRMLLGEIEVSHRHKAKATVQRLLENVLSLSSRLNLVASLQIEAYDHHRFHHLGRPKHIKNCRGAPAMRLGGRKSGRAKVHPANNGNSAAPLERGAKDCEAAIGPPRIQKPTDENSGTSASGNTTTSREFAFMNESSLS